MGMEDGGAAPGEGGTIGVNGRERDGTDAPWVVELRNGDEADEEEQLEAAWMKEIDGSEQMAEWPTEYEEQLWRGSGLRMSTRNEGKHLGMVEEGDVGIGLSLRCVLEAKTL